MSTPTRVAIAEPCRMRWQPAAALLRASGCEVVGIAGTGEEALRLARDSRPDVLLLDVMIEGPGSVDVTRDVTCSGGTAVVLWSAYASELEVRRAGHGLRAGALEVCAKPDAEASDPLWRALLSTIQAAARMRASKTRSGAGRDAQPDGTPVVAIGASTGGPRALQRIVSELPADFSAPIVVALHGNVEAEVNHVDWLQSVSRLEVRCIRDSAALDDAPAGIWLAPPAMDMVCRRGRIRLAPPNDHGHATPSIDRLFHSTATAYGRRAIGVLLSGLGTDGASGLTAIARAGGQTIVQSRASSVAESMPAAALARDATLVETPLDRIATTLQDMVRANRTHTTGDARDGADHPF